MAYVQSAAAILTGKWTYRSFLNDPAQVTSDPNKAAEKLLALLFAEAVFTFEIPTRACCGDYRNRPSAHGHRALGI